MSALAPETRIYVLDVITVALLSFATLAASWCAYQATRWSGEQAAAYNQANAHGIEATRLDGLANNQEMTDVVGFTSWLSAFGARNTELEQFYRARARPEFRRALEAWIQSQPLRNPEAAPSPFALPEYRLSFREQAARLQAEGRELFQQGQAANRHGDDYVLASVLLSGVLFFAGISQQLHRPSMRMVLLAVAVLLCLVGLIRVLRLPIA